MLKNTAGQKLYVLAYDATTGLPKTGDAANLTARVAKDHATAADLTDTSATEIDATNEKGWYAFDTAQAETNADHLRFAARSTTANVVCLCFPTVDEPYTVAASVPAVLTAAGLDDVVVETGLNARQALALAAAGPAGETSGMAAGSSSSTIYAAGSPSTARITTTYTGADRTGITLNLPA